MEEHQVNRNEILQKQLGELTQIFDAISAIEASTEWQKLKRVLFDGLVQTLERQVQNAASKDKIDDSELYRLQGQLMWARRYSDLKKLADVFKKQLENINNQINENPSDGAL